LSNYRSGRALFVPLLALLLILSISACTPAKRPAGKSASPRYGGTINYFLGEPVAIDPAFVTEGEGAEVAKQLFDGLVDYDPKTLALKPAVAQHWSSNKAGDVWTFHLRPGVRFHNGREVTARDFIYSWERVAAKKTGSEVAYHLAPIQGFDKMQAGRAAHLSGLSADGKYTLKVKLNYPFADFPVILGHPVFSPVPKEAVAGGKVKYGDMPVGDGPFAMDGAWRHEQGISLKRFDRYYGAKPYLDGVNFKIFNNQQAGFLDFSGGGLDYAPIPQGQIRATATQYGSRAIVGRPQLALNFFGLNLHKAPFKGNVKLRQAINYAINREAIAANIYEGAYLPAGGIVPPAIEDYKKPADAYTYSPAKAKRLLKEAGHPDGKGLPTLRLVYGAGRGYDEPAQAAQENLRSLGVKVDLAGLEFGAFIEAMGKGDMSIFAASWQGDYPLRDTFLYPLFFSKSGDNMVGFADKKVDRLLLAARKELDAAKRRRLYDQVEVEVLKQAPVVPFAYVGTSVVHSSRVKGFVRTGLDYTPLDRVWLTNN